MVSCELRAAILKSLIDRGLLLLLKMLLFVSVSVFGL